MKKSLQDTRADFSKIIDALAETGPVEITRHGKVVAVLTAPKSQTVSFDHDVKVVGPKDEVVVQTGSFEVSDTPPHPGIKVIPNTQMQQQAARDALLNAMKGKK